MNYSERLKAARRHAGLTQAELASRLGINQTSISDLERGKSLSSSHTADIAYQCGVDPLWLQSGKGAMLKLSGEGLEPAYQPDSYKEYPVISFVEAGDWTEIQGAAENRGSYDELEQTTRSAGRYGFWLKVKGDSMTSTHGYSFSEGMLILVNPELECLPGHFVIAKLVDTQEATFKQYIEDAGRKYLRALNPAYPHIPINGNCRLVGRVIEAKWAGL